MDQTLTCSEVMAKWAQLQEYPLPQSAVCREAVVTLVSLGATRELSGVQITQLGQARFHREGCATCQAHMGKQAELAVVERHIAGCPACKMARHQLVLEAAIQVSCRNVMSLWHEAGQSPRTAEGQRKFNVAERHFANCVPCATKRGKLLKMSQEKAKEPTGSHSLPGYSLPRRRSEEARPSRSSI